MTIRPDPDARFADRPMTELSAYDQPASELTKVDDEECLYCYLLRMLHAFGCSSTHRFTLRWIESQRRRHRWVLAWAQHHGGYCDCEVIFNGFRDDLRSERHRRLRCPASYLDDEDDEDHEDHEDHEDDAEDSERRESAQ